MPTKAYTVVENELRFLGEILGKAIAKKGAITVGVTPEDASLDDMVRALDGHVQRALTNFLGPAGAKAKTDEIKKKLYLKHASGELS